MDAYATTAQAAVTQAASNVHGSPQRVRVHDAQLYTELLDASDWSATLARERRTRQRAMRAAQAADEAARRDAREAQSRRTREAAAATAQLRRSRTAARRDARELQRYRDRLDAFVVRHGELLSTWSALQASARAHDARVRARLYALWHSEVFAPTQAEIDRKVAEKCGSGTEKEGYGDNNNAAAAAAWRERKNVMWRSFLDECNRRAAAPVRGAGVLLNVIDEVEYDPLAQCRAETIRYGARRMPAGLVDARRHDAHELQMRYTRLALTYRDAAALSRSGVLTRGATTTATRGDAPVHCTRALDDDDDAQRDSDDSSKDDDDDDDDDDAEDGSSDGWYRRDHHDSKARGGGGALAAVTDTSDVTHRLALTAPVYTMPLLPSAALLQQPQQTTTTTTSTTHNESTAAATTACALPRVHIPFDFVPRNSPRRGRRGANDSKDDKDNDKDNDKEHDKDSRSNSRRVSNTTTAGVQGWMRERVRRGLTLTESALFSERASRAAPLLVRDMQRRWSAEQQQQRDGTDCNNNNNNGDAGQGSYISQAERDATTTAATTTTTAAHTGVDAVMPLPLDKDADGLSTSPALQQMLPWLCSPTSLLRAKALPREAYLPVTSWATRPLADTIYGRGVDADGSVRESCARHKRDGAYLTHSSVVFDHYHFVRTAEPPHFGKRVYF